MSKKLAISLKVALANEFVAGFITQSAHWNVEGIHFQELHALFGSLYTDLDDDIDVIAEHIRAIDEYSPTSVEELLTASTVKDNMPIGNPLTMISNVQNAITQTKTAFETAFKIAENEDNQGVMDYLSGRIDTFAKHLWMLRAISKGE